MAADDKDVSSKHLVHNITRRVGRVAKWLSRIGLRVDGIEVTQGVQHYRADAHLEGVFPDNSLRLVVGKAALVRVYIRSGLLPLEDVTGALMIERSQLGSWEKIKELSASPPGQITAFSDPSYMDERMNLDSTLNFLVPGELMCGRLRFTAKAGTSEGKTAIGKAEVEVTLRQELRIRAVMFGYSGPDQAGTNLTLAPPSLAELSQIAPWTLQVFPVVPTPSFSVAASIVHTGSLADAKRACDVAALLSDQYQNAKDNDGNKDDVVYLGLVAAGTPASDNAGCGGSASVFVGAGDPGFAGLDGTYELTAETTMAHELGHHLGFQHAPGKTPDPSPLYPVYTSKIPGYVYPPGSIGEFGVDIGSSTVYPPTQFADFMAYMPRRFISPYTWSGLLNQPRLNPSPSCLDLHVFVRKPPKQPLPVISVSGLLSANGSLRITSITRALVATVPREGRQTPYEVELLDENDEALSSGRFLSTKLVSGGCACEQDEPPRYSVLHCYLPDTAPGSAIRVLREDKELFRRAAPSRPPDVRSLKASVTDEGLLNVTWTVASPVEDDLVYWLQWAHTGEDDWHGLAVGLRGNRATVDATSMDPGDVQLRLVAHDGFHSVASSPVEMNVPASPLQALILLPRKNQSFHGNRLFRLYGVKFGGRRGESNPDDYRWSIDGREVARGPEAFVNTPAPGEHLCALLIEVDGEVAADERSFTTFPLRR